MDDYNKRLKETKKALDKIGPGMCLAKWTQTTIHLGLGHTHSCHHPKTHFIPIEEIKKNSSALHSTEYKKSIRKEMLEGKRPSECDYCWKVEDLNDENQISDRIIKSADFWSMPFFNDVLDANYEKNYDPKYLEISFSNVCNFKCSYCMPSVSSQWMEEIEKYGSYPTSTNYNNLDWVKEQKKMPITVREENPYIEAFWDWFPKIYKDLHTFRITGGEPLLDKNTFRVLDYIIENPNKDLELSINSNFCIPDKLFDSFLKKVKFIVTKKLVNKVSIYTSAEAHGAHSEYIRFGMNYEQWKTNCYRFIEEVSSADLGIMATYNLLSVVSFDRFLKDIYDMKVAAYKKSNFLHYSKVYVDIPYLNNPLHQIVGLLTSDYMKLIDNQINFMKSHQLDVRSVPGFTEMEIQKLIRIKTMFSNYLEHPVSELSRHRKDFAIFVDEHDRRRKTNFIETFPEMEEFYKFCKLL